MKNHSLATVSYTHLDVYKRQQHKLVRNHNVNRRYLLSVLDPTVRKSHRLLHPFQPRPLMLLHVLNPSARKPNLAVVRAPRVKYRKRMNRVLQFLHVVERVASLPLQASHILNTLR